MSRTFLSAAHWHWHLRTWGQVSCKYTQSSRLSHDKLHFFLVMVLPEVGKRRSGEADVARIANTRWTRRASHGKILTPWCHFLRGLLVFVSGRSYSSKLGSLFSRSRRSSAEAAWWAQPRRFSWNLRYRCQCGSGCARPPHLWLHRWPSHTTLPQSPKPCHVW